jgi:tetratricopeptide (TPR) repeat protein
VRTLLPLALLLVSVPVPAVRATGEASVPPSIDAAWEASARARLAALDRSGAASEVEIVALTDGLLALSPGDTTLLWRRGDALRRLGQDERALADLQKLIRLAPGSPYAVRARRALPVLFLRAGLDREAAQADEELLARKQVDPAAVLPRLTRTYSKLGQAGKVRATIERLRAIDPERISADRDLAWLEADAIERLGPPAEAASAMLAFAERFPDDRRRGEALVRAARARGDLGDLTPAIEIAGRAIAEPLPPAAAQRTRVARAELLERAGRSREAGEDFRAVLATSDDPVMIERVLSRYTDIEMERRGTEGAVVALAGLVAEGRPAVAGPARQRMAGLLEGLAASRAVAPERAAFLVALAERAGPGIEIPPELRLAAAQLWEGVGDCARASRAYRLLVHEGPAVDREAEQGLERCRPLAPPAGPAGAGTGGRASSP